MDGKPAAATTIARKRAVLHGVVSYAVELDILPANPIDKVTWKAPEVAEEIDRRVVARPRQVRDLLAAVGDISPDLTAFFGCLYYACMSLGLGLLHDVAVKRFTESFCNTSAMCGARCRRCSEACPRRTCNMCNTLTIVGDELTQPRPARSAGSRAMPVLHPERRAAARGGRLLAGSRLRRAPQRGLGAAAAHRQRSPCRLAVDRFRQHPRRAAPQAPGQKGNPAGADPAGSWSASSAGTLTASGQARAGVCSAAPGGGGLLSESSYGRIWQLARQKASHTCPGGLAAGLAPIRPAAHAGDVAVERRCARPGGGPPRRARRRGLAACLCRMHRRSRTALEQPHRRRAPG